MKNLILVSLFVIPALVYSQGKMIKQQINEDIMYMIPESFSLMTKNDRIQKFVSSREPLAMYASEDGEINFGVNWNQMQWIAGDENMIHDFYKASIQSMFDEVDFIQDEVNEINGKKFIVFEFIGSLKSENAFSNKSSKSYTYIQYTSYNDQVLLFNFGCRARLMNQWQPIAQTIMGSIKVK